MEADAEVQEEKIVKLNWSCDQKRRWLLGQIRERSAKAKASITMSFKYSLLFLVFSAIMIANPTPAAREARRACRRGEATSGVPFVPDALTLARR